MYIIQRKDISTNELSYLYKPAEWAYDISKSGIFKTKKSAQAYLEKNWKMFNNKKYQYSVEKYE